VRGAQQSAAKIGTDRNRHEFCLFQRFLGNRFAFALIGSMAVAGRPARAQSAVESPSALSRIAIGGRIGFELPAGDLSGSNPVNYIVTSSIPLGVDLGYRFVERLYVGLHGQYGFANARQTSCTGCGYTTASDAYVVKFGLSAEYDLAPAGNARTPWLGAGFGYELLYAEHTGPGFVNSERWRGFEWIHVAGGVDFEPIEHLRVGPYGGISLGMYNRLRFRDQAEIPVSETGRSDDGGGGSALHGWFTLGVRVKIAPLP
jgi:hypothetical protein